MSYSKTEYAIRILRFAARRVSLKYKRGIYRNEKITYELVTAGKDYQVLRLKEGETMSLEAIQKVTEIEKQMLEKKIAAEAEARTIIAEAEKAGAAMMQKMRNESLEKGKTLAVRAEEKAMVKSAEIQRAAEAESNALREIADQHMDEAVEFIVGRVVNH